MVKKDYRNNLIDTATRLFAERGLKGVGIRELSKAAEVSISMISYHFGGKEGLYSLVLQEQFACFEQIETIRELEAAPLEKIEAYIRWSIRRHREYPYLMRFYTSELTNPTPYFATIVDPAIKKVIRILMETVEEGIRIRHFRQGLSCGYGAGMIGMVNYYFLSTLATREIVSHSPERDEELIRHYMDLFGKGILT
ncbi:TetR/AcrR family transcriptional regulator [Geotalea toluenoxydans]|uniref:TetR/AcrR family transcriptional regulator n=1 Tax=Geotalea toluenoxydans TaxID=421624 RepID=UPI0006D07031|nr:TetR/AcrR family transcriptional regulator [Geotalea toluenoxydans]